MTDLHLNIGKNIPGLQYVTFKQYYDIVDYSQLTQVTGKKDASIIDGITRIIVNTFRSNLESQTEANLEVWTDYHTYMFVNGNVIGHFSGNIEFVSVDNVLREYTTGYVMFDQPENQESLFTQELSGTFVLFSEIPLYYKMILTKDTLDDQSNVYFYGDLQTFEPLFPTNTLVEYKVTFNRLTLDDEHNMFPFLSETETYHLYLYTQNAHGSSNVHSFQIAGTSNAEDPTFTYWDCVSMGNLEDENGIHLELSIQPSAFGTIYYIAAYPANTSMTNLELTKYGIKGVYATSGNLSVDIANITYTNPLLYGSFVRNSNVTVAALLVDTTTGAFSGNAHTLTFVLDTPIISNFIAYPKNISAPEISNFIAYAYLIK